MVFHYNGFVTSLPPVVPPPSSIAVLTKMVAFNGIPCTKSYIRLDKNALPKSKERRETVCAPQESDPQEREKILQGRQVRLGPPERGQKGSQIRLLLE